MFNVRYSTPRSCSATHKEPCAQLSGNFSRYSECHITPDWLLIYKQTDTELLLDRTGTHADLFGM